MPSAGTWRWLGLVACVILGGLYATAAWAQWGLGWIDGFHLGCSRGGVMVARYQVPSPIGFPVPRMFERVRSEGPVEWLPGAGHVGGVGGWEVTYVSVPFWIPLLLVAPPTVVAWRRHRAAVRALRSAGCGRCGYDLSGLAGVACPECGATPK